MSVEDEADLRDQLIRALEENGFLHKLRAKLRAGVFLALEEQPAAKKKLAEKRKKVEAFEGTKEGKGSLALFYDLCQQLHLTATLSVFTKEANITEEILEELPLKNSKDAPAIVGILKQRANPSDPRDKQKSDRDTFPKKSGTALAPIEQRKQSVPDKVKLAPVDSLLESIDEQKTGLAPLGNPEKLEEKKGKEDGFFTKTPHKPSDWLTGSSNEPLAQLTPNKPTERKETEPKEKGKSLLGDLPGMGPKSSTSTTKSFLSDLPDLTGTKNLPPLNSAAKSSIGTNGNFMKLLNDSLEKIENDEVMEESVSGSSSSSSSSTPSAPKPPNEAKKSLEKQDAVSSPSKPSTAPRAGVFKRESPRADTTEDDSVSEIVENLEVDNLLDSGRSEASF